MRRQLLVGGLLAAIAMPAAAADQVNTLLEAMTAGNIIAQMRALQRIADRNDGTRASGSSGYNQSAAYVAAKLRGAGYQVRQQVFDFDFYEELAPSTLRRVSPNPTTFEYGVDFLTMDYSGTGDVTGVIVPAKDVIVPMPQDAPASTSNSGCEPADFNPAPSGTSIALIQRGFCDFVVKAQNAVDAGYDGVIIFNEGQEVLGRAGVLAGTLGAPIGEYPVVGATYALGAQMVQQIRNGATIRATITTETFNEPRRTSNILADSPAGRRGRVVVVGAHLDSVDDGPGINDNGSGTGAILEIALQMARLGIVPRNKLRFAFWGAEEAGLIGSEYYVANLTSPEFNAIDLNLNFDMLGSPNYVRFVYDGDGSDTPIVGPPGSDLIEEVFLEHFDRKGLATLPTAFDGRSDYGPFILTGIPAGGLFSGAEGIKTPEQRRIFGGTAGIAYDPCYHQACDTLANRNKNSLEELGDAAAFATYRFAMRARPVRNAEAATTALSASDAASAMLYRGSKLVR